MTDAAGRFLVQGRAGEGGWIGIPCAGNGDPDVEAIRPADGADIVHDGFIEDAACIEEGKGAGYDSGHLAAKPPLAMIIRPPGLVAVKRTRIDLVVLGTFSIR
jgi:hypothetical protein